MRSVIVLTRTPFARLGDRGATSIEYALLATLIAAVISAAVAVFGLGLNGLFTQILGAF